MILFVSICLSSYFSIQCFFANFMLPIFLTKWSLFLIIDIMVWYVKWFWSLIRKCETLIILYFKATKYIARFMLMLRIKGNSATWFLDHNFLFTFRFSTTNCCNARQMFWQNIVPIACFVQTLFCSQQTFGHS